VNVQVRLSRIERMIRNKIEQRFDPVVVGCQHNATWWSTAAAPRAQEILFEEATVGLTCQCQNNRCGSSDIDGLIIVL
jgi:hypothetical protein